MAAIRTWPAVFVSANYPAVVLGPVPQPTSALIGQRSLADGTVVAVSYVAVGVIGGPELRIAWPSGMTLGVPDEATVQAYLTGPNAAA